MICGPAAISRAAQPPNIVIVLADDMGMGDTSVYQDWSGNPAAEQLHTPALERLARMGVRCTDAHAPHSRCTTSRYALLTGRYCWRTRLKHWVLFGVQCDPLIDGPRVTLPEFLQAAGYRTGMVGKWHLGLKYRNADGGVADGWDDADLTQPLADCPLDHGFDFFHGVSRSHGTSGPNGQRRNAADQAIGPGWLRGRQVIGAAGNGKLLDGSYRYDEIGETLDREAFAFLASAVPSRQPFFLYFASPANHTPYTPSKQVDELPVAGASRFVDGTLTGSRRLDFVYQNDVHVARLLDYLERTEDPRRPGHRLLENTLFLFSSDNGADVPDKLATGPLRSHKASLYEGGHRVPLVAAWPLGGIGDGDPTTPGATCSGLLGLNDLYATFAEILQVPLPPPTGPRRGAEDSFSRWAMLRGETAAERPPLFPNDHQEASRELSDQRAWVAVRSNAAPIPGQWKLLLDHRYAYDGEIHPQELYDLAEDPQESQNRIDDPTAQPTLDFLIQKAREAAGDDGFTRKPLASSDDR
jgi:arylsulfatase A-like enzyme